ncbi:MAG: hypothetical protein ACTTJH_00600 [Bacteroidales bacterium]
MKVRFLGLLASLGFIGLFCCCGSSKKSTQSNITHDTIVNTVYKDKVVYDSIYKYDSIFVFLKNDTVWLEKYLTEYKYKYLHDTVFVGDTIVRYQTKMEIKEVEKKVVPLWCWAVLGIIALVGVIELNRVFRVV